MRRSQGTQGCQAGGDQRWGSCTRSCKVAHVANVPFRRLPSLHGGRSNEYCDELLRILSSLWQLQPTGSWRNGRQGCLRYDVGSILFRGHLSTPHFCRTEESINAASLLCLLPAICEPHARSFSLARAETCLPLVWLSSFFFKRFAYCRNPVQATASNARDDRSTKGILWPRQS